MTNFRIGDIVNLKLGDPCMTISAPHIPINEIKLVFGFERQEGDLRGELTGEPQNEACEVTHATCEWFVGTRHVRHEFHLDFLEHVKAHATQSVKNQETRKKNTTHIRSK